MMENIDKRKEATYHASIAAGSVVCKDIKLLGIVTIGAQNVVHPRASILAENGPIVIGDGNIFEEQTVIRNKLPKDASGQPQTLFIGNNNMFEVSCVCEAKAVGDNCVLEAKCYVGPEVEITNGCFIGAACRLTLPEKLPENFSVCGTNHLRKIMSDKPLSLALQRDHLAKVLPNYHHLKKPRQSSTTEGVIIKKEPEESLVS
ncbi:unnamed protein product [Bemisia tabaci]|uniref:Dynactin subunit 6 n=1 Tax=Bemisia tabaci TaxID=7038 RepID=A0A9P0AI46_BEMTA|nr:PREDICTED: dynactin subunit 6-like [Bemisia tabaci]CAH0390980.1 unnamed protein product [Bemisia tabaci]